MSRGNGGTAPSAGARGDAHSKPPRLASVCGAAWSSVATGVTYGDGETRLSRAQLRAGLRARKALKKRGALVPSASKKPGVFVVARARARQTTTARARVSDHETALGEAVSVSGARSRRARVETFDPANNAVAHDKNVRRFETFGEAFAAESDVARAEKAFAAEPEPLASTVNASAEVKTEYRDASGEPFTVRLTNAGSPESGLTTIELRGFDRANLLGALCSALARAEVSVVSGSIDTDTRTGAVRNVMRVCDRTTRQRLDPRAFESLSARVLSACWSADERAWLAPPRSVGRFIVAGKNPNRARARRALFAEPFRDEISERLRDRADAAEAKMRACSARLADAVERADGRDAQTELDATLRALLRDVEDAAAESFAARSALEAETQPRAVAGFAAAPAPLFEEEASLERSSLERRGAEDDSSDSSATEERAKTSAGSKKSARASASSSAAWATLAAATASDDVAASRRVADVSASSVMRRLGASVTNAYDDVSPFFKGVFFMNVASCLFGTNQVVIKQVADAGVDDFTQMFLRFAVAAVPLVPFIYQGAKGSNRVELFRGATHLGTILAVGYFLQIIGLEGTTSAKGALTSTFTVLSVPVFAGFAGQKVPWFTWPASVAAIIGVGLLTGGDGSPFATGDAVCILSAIIFGYHTLTSSKYAQLFEDQELPFISFQIGVVAAESGLWKLGEMGYRGFRERAADDAAAAHAMLTANDVSVFFAHTLDVAAHLPWPALLWMGLATTSFTLWIEFLALKNVSASTCALIYTAEPLWGALFAWHFMGDRWGAAGWLGATLIVGASVGSQVLTFDEDDEKKAKKSDGEKDAMHVENFARY